MDDILVSDEILSEKFVCDLNKCKGGCCVDGDAGAPLAEDELETMKEIYPIIKKYLSPEAISEIEKVGIYTRDSEFDWVTPDINNGICVYGYTDELGIVKCAIEKAYLNNEIEFKKPISCHLFPIRVSKNGKYEALNYEPREDEHLCAPACRNGKKLDVPVYKFLQEPITRKYGADFYDVLDKVFKWDM